MSDFLVGLDLGQSQDYTALVVAERVQVPTGERSRYDGTPICLKHYHVRHIQRFALGTAYPVIVEQVAGMLRQGPLVGRYRLVVDATGVGAPVVDLFRQGGMSPTGVTITGGNTPTHEGANWLVPKRDLVSTMQVLLQSRRLMVAEELPEAPLLVKELLDFQVKITMAAHDIYGAWREGQHDDLVLATALAVWFGERMGDGPRVLFL